MRGIDSSNTDSSHLILDDDLWQMMSHLLETIREGAHTIMRKIRGTEIKDLVCRHFQDRLTIQ